ncbi:MAG: hypothetical protein QOH15_2867 [Gaiellales bacterium]|jgi:hypothetical protein|nr:hypothetical protein [Gaiellales bacterium]
MQIPEHGSGTAEETVTGSVAALGVLGSACAWSLMIHADPATVS